MNIKFKIPKQVLILSLVSFFTDFASEMLYPVTPIFLSSALGASMGTIGAIEGIAEITANLLKGFFGALSDKIRKRALFVKIGYSLSAAVKPLPGVFPNVGVIASARTIDRIGKGIRTSPRDALLAGEANASNKGAIFGFHRSLDTFGAVVGPLIALLILFYSNNDFRTVYYFSAIPSVFAIAFVFLVKEKAKTRTKSKKYNYLKILKTLPANLKILLLFVALFSLVNSSDVFLILKLKETSSDFTAIGGYIYFNAVYALFSYPFGILSDKYGKRNIFAFGLLVFSIVYLIFAISSSVTVLFFGFTLYGFYSAATDGILKAWISDLTDDSIRSTIIGLFNTVSGICILIASVVAGVLWDNFGSSLPFLISSVGALIISVLIFSFANFKQARAD